MPARIGVRPFQSCHVGCHYLWFFRVNKQSFGFLLAKTGQHSGIPLFNLSEQLLVLLRCVTNIHIRIRIPEYQSEYSYSYSYAPFFVTPNIFGFVFALFYQPKYIHICICLRHGNQIY